MLACVWKFERSTAWTVAKMMPQLSSHESLQTEPDETFERRLKSRFKSALRKLRNCYVCWFACKQDYSKVMDVFHEMLENGRPWGSWGEKELNRFWEWLEYIKYIKYENRKLDTKRRSVRQLEQENLSRNRVHFSDALTIKALLYMRVLLWAYRNILRLASVWPTHGRFCLSSFSADRTGGQLLFPSTIIAYCWWCIINHRQSPSLSIGAIMRPA